ncbi:cytosine permease [Streptomyces sp. NBC_00984]|uniref:cytosine permease n=1 Tax=Streptomyces sp. NBC_00984 TaxID=2903700 RepID=UPI00386809BD|nr:cytosine permease [Streptomyces sp. NBC_00984]
MTTTNPNSSASPLDEHGSERTGHVETRGIDLVPADERGGRPRRLFAVWAAPNVSYLSFVVGATLILMDLTLPQALGVILAGNLLWICTGVIAASGPAMAVAVTDLVLRGNRYNGRDLLEQRRGCPFWYHGGVHRAGFLAIVVGGLTSALWVNTSFWVGPIAKALDDIDMAIPSGMIAAAAVYWAMTRALRSIPRD